MSEKINIRGVEFNNVTFEEAVSLLLDAVREKKQTALFTPNSEIVQACIEKGVLCLTAKDKVRLLPALNIDDKLLKDAIDVLKEVCADQGRV